MVNPCILKDISVSYTVNAFKRPKGRPSGSIMKPRFNPKVHHLPFNTGLPVLNPKRIYKHSDVYM